MGRHLQTTLFLFLFALHWRAYAPRFVSSLVHTCARARLAVRLSSRATRPGVMWSCPA